jgi:hypothetical protein
MKEFAIFASSVLVGISVSGCGGGGTTPAPTPAPTPVPTTPAPTTPPVKVAPDPATWTYRIPDASSFHCITETDLPSGANKYGFYMYRWTTKAEAEDQDVSSDDLGDINPYYFLTELMTDLSDHPLASKSGSCHIPQCGENEDECVLERIYIKYNTEAISELTHAGIWGQFLNIDNGIPDYYAYWAFNYSTRDNPLNPANCEETIFSQACNFWFRGGYPLGCQTKSDLLDKPVWYSLVGGCPKYPWDASSSSPAKVSSDFVWHNKLDKSDPDVAACWDQMPGGNACDGGRTDPFRDSSKTCTWQALKAGYLDVKDVLNIESTYDSYTQWCKEPGNIAADYGRGNGIPSNMTLFYNLSSEAFPVMESVQNKDWHEEAGADDNQISKEAKSIFQNFAVHAKQRLNQMFEAMDKQAFAYYNKNNLKDPKGKAYVGCKSNDDITPPLCSLGASQQKPEVVV